MARWPLNDFDFSADGQVDAEDRSIITTWGFNLAAAGVVIFLEVLGARYRTKPIVLKQAGPIGLKYRSKLLRIK